MLFTIIRRWLGPEKSHVDSGLMSEFDKTTIHALIRFHVENQASPVPEAVRLKVSVFSGWILYKNIGCLLLFLSLMRCE